ncbi:MAG: sigma-70 family RNA polymerase sigma factor [Bacteroidales bacterium]|nr:sigma-70 family RNA polymerase sigma factor [Bacteroidales bacterium]
MTEAEIIKKLKEGSEKAFRDLVSTYQKMVVNICYGIVHNIEDAEDVAQDVFIEVFRSVSGFRGDSKLSTWIYRIAVNRSINYLRDHKRRSNLKSLDETVDSSKSAISELFYESASDPQKEMENIQRSKILYAAIGTLSKNQRFAFTLNKYEGLSYKEISEIMELSISSVESLMHRAKKNLQKRLYSHYKKKSI